MIWKPMRAATLPAPFIVAHYPVLASAKLDGVRAMVQGGRLVSRNLKPIPNAVVQKLYGRSEFEGLDGELIAGDPCAPDCFRKTTSAVMRRNGAPEVTFYVFDCFDLRLAFVRRLQMAERIMDKARKRMPCYAVPGRPRCVQSCLQLVTHKLLPSDDALRFYENVAVQQGYEGAMLRDPYGLYKQGRSTLKEGGLLKLKRFCDGEALVIGVEELMHNDNAQEQDALGRSKRSSKKAGLRPAGMLGALLVRDLKTKVEFSIGSGFTEEMRRDLWHIYKRDLPAFGKERSVVSRVAKYRYFPTGGKERPRFPVFVGFRDRRDM